MLTNSGASRAGTLALISAMPSFALAQSERSEFFHGMWGESGGWGYMGHGMGIIFWIFIIVLIIFAVRWATDRNGNDQNPGSPLDILKERFAKGEIDQAEFEEKRKVLRS